MFAALGEIQFEVVGSPEGYESAGAYDFSEQRVIESKPRLQWVGDDLERLNFELMWHSSFTNPAVQLALLRATAAQHLALPLVFGNGGFRGFFVIESIKMKSQQLSAGGAPIAIRVALALKEWIADPQLASGARPVADIFSARNHDGIDRNRRQRLGRIHARRVGIAQYPVRDRHKRSQS